MIESIYFLIINLSHRKERWEHIHNHLCHDMGISEDHIIRIDAIYTPHDGHRGCAASHVKSLEYALEHNLSRIIILEDDAFFKSKQQLLEMVTHVSAVDIEMDVIFLMIHAYTVNMSADTIPESSHLLRLFSGCCMAGLYYPSTQAIQKLCTFFKHSVQQGLSQRPWYIDRCWWNASKEGQLKTYVYVPFVANIIDDHSDITNSNRQPSKWMDRTEKHIMDVIKTQSNTKLMIRL